MPRPTIVQNQHNVQYPVNLDKVENIYLPTPRENSSIWRIIFRFSQVIEDAYIDWTFKTYEDYLRALDSIGFRFSYNGKWVETELSESMVKGKQDVNS